jgi:hypothetical protein
MNRNALIIEKRELENTDTLTHYEKVMWSKNPGRENVPSSIVLSLRQQVELSWYLQG